MNLFIQFAPMKKNYHRFHEILFIDNSISHQTAAMATESAHSNKNPEYLHLILLSGVNNEGKNVLFGFALTRYLEVKSYKWILKQFVEFSKHKAHGKVYPATIITKFDTTLNEAVQKVFGEHSTTLIC
jgi:hypothetical protein